MTFLGRGVDEDINLRYDAGSFERIFTIGDPAPGVPGFSFARDDRSYAYAADGTNFFTSGIGSDTDFKLGIYRVDAGGPTLLLDSANGTFPDGTEIQSMRDVAVANGRAFTTATHFENVSNGTIDQSEVLLLGESGPQSVLAAFTGAVPGQPGWELTGFDGPLGTGNYLVVGSRINNNIISEPATAFLRYDVATDGTLTNSTLLAHAVDGSDLRLDNVEALDLNDAGLTLLRGGGGGLYTADGNSLVYIVNVGDSIDDISLTINSLGGCASIDGDRILFSATLADSRRGLYLWQAGSISTLIDTTRTLDGTALTGLSFQSNQSLQGDEFTFVASFSDGTTGIYLATIPEPATALLLLTGVGCLVGRHRQRQQN